MDDGLSDIDGFSEDMDVGQSVTEALEDGWSDGRLLGWDDASDGISDGWLLVLPL